MAPASTPAGPALRSLSAEPTSRRALDFRCSPSPGHSEPPMRRSPMSRRLTPAVRASSTRSAVTRRSRRGSTAVTAPPESSPVSRRMARNWQLRSRAKSTTGAIATGPSRRAPSTISIRSGSPGADKTRCAIPAPVRASVTCRIGSRSEPTERAVSILARNAHGLTSTDQIGFACVQSCAGFSAKVQSPASDERHRRRSIRHSAQAADGGLVTMIAT